MKSNIMLQGGIGTGKTYCLRTLLKAELDPFIISLEPGLDATLGDVICPHGAIHHTYIYPTDVSWNTIRKYVTLASTLTLDNLIKTTDPGKSNYDQFNRIMTTCSAFTCDGCGENFGDIADWGPERAIAIDGLTGLTKAARQLIIGARPVIAKHEYQPIQGYIEAFLDLFWGGTKCTAILLAHTDRRPDEDSGINQLTIDTAGPALVRKLVRKPDEIITTERDEKGVFTWNTTYSYTTVTKQRRLPESADLPPDFATIFRPS